MENKISATSVLKSHLINGKNTQASAIHEECIKNLAKESYKYQFFKASVALKRMNCKEYKKATIQKALYACRVFCKNGNKDPHMSSLFYKTINDLRAIHFSILTPSEKDKYVPNKKVQKNPVLSSPVSKLPEFENKPQDEQSRTSVDFIIPNIPQEVPRSAERYEKYICLLRERIEVTDKIVSFLEEEINESKNTNKCD